MDNGKHRTARKAHELTGQLEEDDLWDLANDLPDSEINTTEAPTPQPMPPVEATTEQKIAPTPPPADSAKEVTSKSELKNQPETPENTPSSTTTNTIQRTRLSIIEKVTLSALAILFLGLATWGYLFLYEKNHLGKAAETLKFPIEGKYITISDFKTFWKNPEGMTGIKLGAQIIPAASITLAEDNSGSGALRVYFRNAEKTSVGDPITIYFSNGEFNNGDKNIEITATDGFHQAGDFNAYALDRALAWRIEILEAPTQNSSGSEFEPIINTMISPDRK